MKTKTKNRIKQFVIYGLVALFVIGTLLIYLPIGEPQPASTAPPLEGLPGTQQGAPVQPGIQAQPPAGQQGQPAEGQAPAQPPQNAAPVPVIP